MADCETADRYRMVFPLVNSHGGAFDETGEFLPDFARRQREVFRRAQQKTFSQIEEGLLAIGEAKEEQRIFPIIREFNDRKEVGEFSWNPQVHQAFRTFRHGENVRFPLENASQNP